MRQHVKKIIKNIIISFIVANGISVSNDNNSGTSFNSTTNISSISSINCTIISRYNTVTEQGRHCTYDVTTKRVLATILAMEER